MYMYIYICVYVYVCTVHGITCVYVCGVTVENLSINWCIKVKIVTEFRFRGFPVII